VEGAEVVGIRGSSCSAAQKGFKPKEQKVKNIAENMPFYQVFDECRFF
jgi:hypothetical protein